MLSLLESPQDRKAAAGRGRRRTGLNTEIQVAGRDRKLDENLPEGKRTPTENNSKLVKDYRRIVTLGGHLEERRQRRTQMVPQDQSHLDKSGGRP